MLKKIVLLGLLVSSSIVLAQNDRPEKKGFYFLVGATYFVKAATTEFPTVGGLSPTNETSVNNVVTSREHIKGTFGEGFRINLVEGYRSTNRLGLEIGTHYYVSNTTIMAERHNFSNAVNYDLTVKGTIKNFDLSPSLVVFLGERGKFEPFSRIGFIIPFYGRSEIITTQMSSNPSLAPNVYKRDVIKPDATIGFTAALGTSYKISGKFSAYTEVEFRNLTSHGKTKETTDYSINGVDQIPLKSYSETHTEYVDSLNASSNALTNPNGIDPNKALNELRSSVGISGVGLTLAVRYTL